MMLPVVRCRWEFARGTVLASEALEMTNAKRHSQYRLQEMRVNLMVNVSWQVELPVEGRCQDCGEDLSTRLRIWATREWVRRYESDERLRRSVDRAVAERVVERHTPHCAGRSRRAS